MKINFDSPLLSIKGEQLKANDGEEITLGWAAVESLLSNIDIQGVDSKSKLMRFLLAEKIYASNGEVELPIEEVSLIKELIGKWPNTVIVGASLKILN